MTAQEEWRTKFSDTEDLVRSHEMKDALEAAWDCLEFAASEIGPQTEEAFSSRREIAEILTDLGRLRDALEMERKALEIGEALWGEDGPHLAETLCSIGELCHKLGRLGEAEEMLARGVSLAESGKRPCDRVLLRLRKALTKLNISRGDLAAAEFHQRQSVYEQITWGLYPANPHISLIYGNLAEIHAEQDRWIRTWICRRWSEHLIGKRVPFAWLWRRIWQRKVDQSRIVLG